MELFAERLNWACDRAGIKPKNHGRQRDLGKIMDVTSKAARRWLEGEGMPKTTTITKLAEKLGVQANWLLSGEGPRTQEERRQQMMELATIAHESFVSGSDEVPANTAKPPPPAFIPLIDWSDVVTFARGVYIKQPTDGPEMIEVAKKVGPRSFALRVEGDSMEPEFPDGIIIVVDPDSPAKNKSFVLAQIPGHDEATFMQLVIVAGIRYLKPMNEKYRQIEMPDGTEILGVIREAKWTKSYD